MRLKPLREESLAPISITNGASLFAFPALLVPMVPQAQNPYCYLGDWPPFVFRFWTLLPGIIGRGVLQVGLIISMVLSSPFLLISPPALSTMVCSRTILNRQKGFTSRRSCGAAGQGLAGGEGPGSPGPRGMPHSS